MWNSEKEEDVNAIDNKLQPTIYVAIVVDVSCLFSDMRQRMKWFWEEYLYNIFAILFYLYIALFLFILDLLLGKF